MSYSIIDNTFLSMFMPRFLSRLVNQGTGNHNVECGFIQHVATPTGLILILIEVNTLQVWFCLHILAYCLQSLTVSTEEVQQAQRFLRCQIETYSRYMLENKTRFF